MVHEPEGLVLAIAGAASRGLLGGRGQVGLGVRIAEGPALAHERFDALHARAFAVHAAEDLVDVAKLVTAFALPPSGSISQICDEPPRSEM